MKLQVVSNFNQVNNEATSCFRAQTSKDETKSCFESIMATSFFRAQTSKDETKSFFQLQTTENEATSFFNIKQV